MQPIRGEVTFNDAPLASGLVVYLPKPGGSGRQAMGPIKADGSFVLTTQVSGDGAMHGDYDIVIYANGGGSTEGLSREQIEAAARQRPKSVIPTKYAQPSTSGLSDVVNADHSGFKQIVLSE